MTDNCIFISDDVKLGKNVMIEPFTIIKENVIIENDVTIGKGAKIYENVIIKAGSRIGENCVIGHPTKMDLSKNIKEIKDEYLTQFIINKKTSIIGKNGIIRSNTVIYSHTIIGDHFNTGHNSVIRENTTIGKNCVIGTGAVTNGFSKIGDYTRINTICALPQTMIIGKGVFIAPMVAFSDNINAVLGEGNRSPIIEDFVRIGIGSNILPNIIIGENSMIGAGSVVTKNVPKNVLVYGVPAKAQRNLDEREIELYRNSIIRWG